MVVYGIAMLLIGATMDAGTSPAMRSATLTGLGMLSVGALMLVNGSLMLRSGRDAHAMPSAGATARPAT